MPSELDRQAAEALDKALELMNNEGAHWTQGAHFRDLPEGEVAYCAIGALQEVTHGWGNNVFLMTRDPVIRHAAKALASAYYRRPLTFDSGEHYIFMVEEWNDLDTTKWSTVVKRFKRARNQLLRKGK